MSPQLHQHASGGPLKEPPPDVGSHGPSQTPESDDFDGGGGGPPLLPKLEGPQDEGSPFPPRLQGQPPRVHPTAQERAPELDGDIQCLKRLSKEGLSRLSEDEGSALDEGSRHDETLFFGPEDAKNASLASQIGLGEGPPLSFISTRPGHALQANWGPLGVPLGSSVENPQKSPLVACLEGPLEAHQEASLEVPLGASLKDPLDAPLEAPLDASLEAQLDVPLGALTGVPVGASLSASLLSPQDVSWRGVPQRPSDDSAVPSLNFMDALCSLALVDRPPPPRQLPQQRQRTAAAYRATRHDSLLSAASTASSVARAPLNASEGSKGYRGPPQLPSLRSSGDPWAFAMQGMLPAQQQQKQQRQQQQRPVQQQSMQLQMLEHQTGQQKQYLPPQQEQQQRRPQLQQHFARQQQQRTLQQEHQALQQLQQPHQQGWQQNGAPVSAQRSLNHIEVPAASISFQEMKDPLWSLTTHPETEAAFESASILRVQHQAICSGIQRLPQRAPPAQLYSVWGAESLDPSSSGSSGVHEQQLLQQLPLQDAAQGACLAPAAATEACRHLQVVNSDLEGAAMRPFSGAPEGHRGRPGEFNVILKCYLELLLRKQQEQQRQRQQQQRQRQPQQRQHQQQQQQRQQLQQQQRLFQRGVRRQRGQRGAPAAPLGVFGAAQLRGDPPGWVVAAGYLQQQQQPPQLLIRAAAAAEERSPATNVVINALPTASRSEGGAQGPPQVAHLGGISTSWPPCHDPVRARLMQFVKSPGVESFPAAAEGAAAYMVPDLLQGGPPCIS
ncbi:hypothetical protein, conserved [Eimeria maxima]|uniref:Uncharacterized protein n=1 Tax=Eimeria maxima TaxID=5804 RepID=U6MD13_EIMMA|nr:hypothetical protein, conserved [Eimeria maxima]CDJ61926.1 hypothetical protein, conserved [Eimeria maxima]